LSLPVPHGTAKAMLRFLRLLSLSLWLTAGTAQAAVGLSEIAASANDGPVTVFYPSNGPQQPLRRGPFTLSVAWQGPPVRGNGRLVVISHGSGAAPWVQADLARALVEAGFMVALPRHRENNHLDDSSPGPPSWQRRPAEVSRTIDAIGADARFAPLLALDKVGMYGMSAGGHTALVMAGGRWSKATLMRHCEAHIAEDFHACAGPTTRLDGGWLDGAKQAVVLWFIRNKWDDEQWHAHHDPRIAAVVAGVPFAADFDMSSLATPRAPLALITARKDVWLVPRFNSDAVLKACAGCERLADFATGGHGALLSPLPPAAAGLLGELINDPPGFDRAETAVVERRVVNYCARHLLP
jgi:predicted dienelactone hydrolase